MTFSYQDFGLSAGKIQFLGLTHQERQAHGKLSLRNKLRCNGLCQNLPDDFPDNFPSMTLREKIAFLQQDQQQSSSSLG